MLSILMVRRRGAPSRTMWPGWWLSSFETRFALLRMRNRHCSSQIVPNARESEMSVPPLRLGVNIDHVATLRNARSGERPDPVRAALLAIEAGADGITAHLRE